MKKFLLYSIIIKTLFSLSNVLQIYVTDSSNNLVQFQVNTSEICMIDFAVKDQYTLIEHSIIYPLIKMWNKKEQPRPPAVIDWWPVCKTLLFVSQCFMVWSSLSKNWIPSIAGCLGRPFWFHIFFSLAFFSLSCYFLHPGWDYKIYWNWNTILYSRLFFKKKIG